MILYIYESHLGGNLYVTTYEQDYDDLYCEECGDSDTYCCSGTPEDLLKNILADYKERVKKLPDTDEDDLYELSRELHLLMERIELIAPYLTTKED